jgi:phosphoglycolate phosphatase
MNNFQAVIFDLDGTLINSLRDIADATNRILAKHDFPEHPYEAYRCFVGAGLRNLTVNALPDGKKDEHTVDKCFHALLDDYRENYLVKTELYDGIAELLDLLAERKIKMAVLSNKADEITQKIASVLLKPWKFEIIMGHTERFPRKPNPDSALFIAKELDVLPENICYAGDTGIDMETAIRAGMFAVGVTWGFRKRDELERFGARKIIDKPLELLSNGMD